MEWRTVPVAHKSHRHPHLDKASCGNARSDCAVSMDGARSTFPRESFTWALRGAKKRKAHSFQSTPLCCSELVLRLWELGNPEMYLPILKKSKVFAGRHHFCVCVCVSKGFGLKAHPEDSPDAWSLSLSAKWAEGSCFG